MDGRLLELLGGQTGEGAALPFDPAVEPWPGLLRAYLDREGPSGKADRLIEALREEGLLEAEALSAVDPSELVELSRSAGAVLRPPIVATILRLAAWAVKTGPERLDQLPTESLRDGLRSLRGVGPTLADSLLLHGLGRSTFPVDRASYRIAVRHGWIEAEAGYEEAHSVLTDLAPDDASALASIADAFEVIGRRHCKPKAPRCHECQLQPLLPESGPIQADIDGD